MALYELIKQSKNIDELASVLLESAIIDDMFLKVYCPYDCEHYNKSMNCCMLFPDEVCGTYKVAKKDLKNIVSKDCWIQNSKFHKWKSERSYNPAFFFLLD